MVCPPVCIVVLVLGMQCSLCLFCYTQWLGCWGRSYVVCSMLRIVVCCVWVRDGCSDVWFLFLFCQLCRLSLCCLVMLWLYWVGY